MIDFVVAKSNYTPVLGQKDIDTMKLLIGNREHDQEVKSISAFEGDVML